MFWWVSGGRVKHCLKKCDLVGRHGVYHDKYLSLCAGTLEGDGGSVKLRLHCTFLTHRGSDNLGQRRATFKDIFCHRCKHRSFSEQGRARRRILYSITELVVNFVVDGDILSYRWGNIDIRRIGVSWRPSSGYVTSEWPLPEAGGVDNLCLVFKEV